MLQVILLIVILVSVSCQIGFVHNNEKGLVQQCNGHGNSDHDDVIKWKHFPCYRTFVRGIYQSTVNSPRKGQWRRALMFSMSCGLNKRLRKQQWGWWFETPTRSLWRHFNASTWTAQPCIIAHTFLRCTKLQNIYFVMSMLTELSLLLLLYITWPVLIAVWALLTYVILTSATFVCSHLGTQ